MQISRDRVSERSAHLYNHTPGHGIRWRASINSITNTYNPWITYGYTNSNIYSHGYSVTNSYGNYTYANSHRYPVANSYVYNANANSYCDGNTYPWSRHNASTRYLPTCRSEIMGQGIRWANMGRRRQYPGSLLDSQ